MARREQERAADADREEIAERLRQAVTEGRLDLDEFDERLARTYRARTYGELDRLVLDLPRPSPVPAAGSGDPQRYPYAVRQWLAEQWRPWLTVVAICTMIWLLTSIVSRQALYFWPVWVAVPWGAVMLYRTIFGLSSGEPQHWAAHRAREVDNRRNRA